MRRLQWIGWVALAACGGADSTDSGSTSATSPATTGAAASTTGEPDTTAPTTSTTPPGDTTSTPTTADPSTGPAVPSTTTGTAATGTDESNTNSCVCAPDELLGCIDVLTANICSADCSEGVPTACPPGQACLDGQGCTATACIPDQSLCADDDSVHTCKPDGTGFADPVACAADEGCADGVCTALCILAELSPRSLGCSFFAHTMDNYYAVEADSVIAGNAHPSKPATVQLYVQKNGFEQAVGMPVVLAPGDVHEFQLTEPEIESASAVRSDGAYRVVSDIPIVAYQHAPRTAQLTNDASMLLPEPALAQNYVIASAREGTLHKNHASYFVVIATADDTTVRWTPPVASLAGPGVPAVAAGQTGEVTLGRLATLQVAAAFTQDLTGTYVTADRPIWVVGASACTAEPVGNYTCDHIEEQMLPIDYWGKTYVAAHAPERGSEKYQWRVFGGADGVQISTSPDVTNGPFTLDKGDVKLITATQHFVMEGDGPFLPVQYLESQTAGAGTGDPSTVQMIPVEQFLNRYVFATGIGYDPNYVQIIRTAGGAAVTVDGVEVNGYTAVGAYEIADWPIDEGSHVADSQDPFAIINIGYTDFTSYAYPGGMKLDVITPQ